jgi:hypothetical protein
MSVRAAFTRGDDPAEFIAIEGAAGPWSPDTCHGGAPAALLVQVAEGMAAPAPMSVARVTMDLLRRVPLGPLRVESRVVREGKKIQLLALELGANGVEVARATVLRMRREPETVPDPVSSLTTPFPGPDAGWVTTGATGGFAGLFTMRAVRGGFEHKGPGSVWFRMDAPLVAGMATRPAARAVAAADFANGVASVLSFDQWLFPSTDLTAALLRQPEGDWVLVDAESWIGAEGRSLGQIRLGDEHGWFGSATQTSLLEARHQEGRHA